MKQNLKIIIVAVLCLFVFSSTASAMILPIRFPIETTNRTDTPLVNEINHLYNTDGTNTDTTDNTTTTVPKVLYLKAKVMTVENVTYSVDSTIPIGTTKQISQIKISGGVYKDRVYEVTSYLKEGNAKQIELKKGQNVLLSAQLTTDETDIQSVYVYDYYRLSVLVIVVVLVILLCIVFLGMRGVRAIISILVMGAYVLFVFVPFVLKGISPALLIAPICILIAGFNIVMDLGFSKQAFAAGVGGFFGFAFAAFISAMVQRLGTITGLGESETTLLAFMPNQLNVDFAGLFVAGVMILFMGYIVKITTDCVKYLDESYQRNKYVSRKDLIYNGFAHCIDNMCNLLQILFYSIIAALIPLLVVYGAYITGYTGLFNMDAIAIGLFRVACVAVSLFVSVPLTCVVYSFILKGKSIY